MSKIEELRRLESEATPGPWRSNALTGSNHRAVMVGGDNHYVYLDQNANAALIAATRNSLPALLRVVEAAAALIEDGNEAYAWASREMLRKALAALETD